MGRGVVRLLAGAYRERGRSLPRWVKQLAAHYGVKPEGG